MRKQQYIATVACLVAGVIGFVSVYATDKGKERREAEQKIAETTQQETTKAESTASAESLNTDEAKDSEESKADSAADQEEASMTGTISDIKDFMFTITFDGQDYGFSFDQNEKPQGLDSVKDGDTVMVTYTGTVNTVDAFTGKILSVEKVD